MIGAAFFIASLFALWTVLHRITALTSWRVSPRSAAFIAKPSAPLFVPVGLALIAVQLIGRRCIAGPSDVTAGVEPVARSAIARCMRSRSMMAAHVVVAYVVTGPRTAFDITVRLRISRRRTRSSTLGKMLETPGITMLLARWDEAHHVLPEAYRQLFCDGRRILATPDRVSEWRRYKAGRAFLPIVALVKTTLAGLLLVIAALVQRLVGVAPPQVGKRQCGVAGIVIRARPSSPWRRDLRAVGFFEFTSETGTSSPIIPLVMILTGIVGPVVVGAWSAVAARPARRWNGGNRGAVALACRRIAAHRSALSRLLQCARGWTVARISSSGGQFARPGDRICRA